MQELAWVLMIISVIGALFVSRANIVGYYLWLVSNMGWIVVNVYYGIHGQAVQAAVFFVITCYGIYQWKKYKVHVDRKEES